MAGSVPALGSSSGPSGFEGGCLQPHITMLQVYETSQTGTKMAQLLRWSESVDIAVWN